MAPKYTLFFFFFICIPLVWSSEVNKNEEFISSVEDTMEKKFGEYTSSLTNWLKSINDRNLVNSDAGRMLHYKDLEPKVEKAGNTIEGRNMKKMSSLLPLIFHLGMTSAWMLLTTILTAKSVAIGVTLLIIKIAVGSAKLASYFTAWKHKHHHPHYEYVPHYEHHGHKRSLRSVESHQPHQDWHGYSPEYSHSHTPYSSHFEASSSPYASSHEGSSSPYYAQAYGEYQYPVESKKAQEKKLNVEEDSRLEAKSKLSEESNNHDIPLYRGQVASKMGPYPPFAGGHWEPKDSSPFGDASGPSFWNLFF